MVLGRTQAGAADVEAAKRVAQLSRVAALQADREAPPIVREKEPLRRSGGEPPYHQGSPLQGPNHWENYSMAAARAAGLGGPTGPGSTGFLAGTDSTPASARAKQHATYQMHYSQREGLPQQGGGGALEYRQGLDEQILMQQLLQQQQQQQQQMLQQQHGLQQQQGLTQLQFATPRLGQQQQQQQQANARTGAHSVVSGIGALAVGQRPTPRGSLLGAAAGGAPLALDPSAWTAGQTFAVANGQAQAQRALQQAAARGGVYKGGFPMAK